ncbi:MAG: cytochrome C oxidase subunit IV family protein [Ardenticatenales bacterium]|nr:cytochrome C oxidase subunit IV family protein [Ardenticatenales bacterium]
MAQVKVHETPVDDEHLDHDHDHHGGSFQTYWIIAGVLLAATLTEVYLSEQLPAMGITGGALAGAMLGIAVFKAALVIMFYMHLKYEKGILWLIFLLPFFLVSLLFFALFAQP